MARLKSCAASIAVLATIARVANAEPTTQAAAASEHVARFALVLSEPRAVVEACGGAAVIEKAVERRLERDPFTNEAGADATLIVSVAPRVDAQWQVHINERDASGAEVGQRDVLIDAEDCTKGIETLAVVLSIMIGPPRMLPGPPPGTSAAPMPQLPPVDQGAPIPTPPRPAEPRPTVRTETRPKPTWSVAPAAGLTAGSGILPGISWGLEGGAIVHPPVNRLSFIARGQLWPTRAAGTQPEVHLERKSLSLLACLLAARRSSASVTLCTGVDGGWLDASAPALGGMSTRPLLDVPIEARVGFELSRAPKPVRIEPWLSAQLAVLVLRDRFTFQDRTDRQITLHRAAPIGLAGSVGLTLRFGPR